MLQANLYRQLVAAHLPYIQERYEFLVYCINVPLEVGRQQNDLAASNGSSEFQKLGVSRTKCRMRGFAQLLDLVSRSQERLQRCRRHMLILQIMLDLQSPSSPFQRCNRISHTLQRSRTIAGCPLDGVRKLLIPEKPSDFFLDLSWVGI